MISRGGTVVRNLACERIEDLSAWDGFVEASPQGTVFSSSRWLESAARAQGGTPVFLGVKKNDEIVAGMPFVSIVRGPFRKATTPVLTPYGGMAYRPNPGKRSSEAESFNADCARLIIDEAQRDYNGAFIVHSPGFDDVRPFTWNGWREHVRYTYVMDITDPDALWDSLERRVRTVIRNAETSLKLGGAIDTEHFSALYERIYGDRGNPPPVATGVLRAMAEDIVGSGLGVMRTVSDEHGDIVSAMILVHDNDTVYAWISGSVPGENSSGAFSLLFWDAVRRYSASFGKLDMIGANIPSIAFFKKGFAGALIPYYVTEYHSSPFVRFAFSAYGRVRRMLTLKR